MIIATINTKGGVGKTTTCLYLAEAARRGGRQVTVWDADPQGTALSWSDLADDDGGPLGYDVVGIHRRRLTRDAAKSVEGDVIIDTPPGDPHTIHQAAAAADLVIVVTGPGGADVDRAIETMDHHTGDTPALVLLTQYIKQETDSWGTWRSIRASDYAVFDTPIPRRAAIQRAYGTAIDGDLYGHDRLLTEIIEAVEHVTAQKGA